MSLSSTIDLKREKGMLYVPLDFEVSPTTDVFADSGAYIIATAQKDLDSIKQQAPVNNVKNDNPPSFHIQIANGYSEYPLATAILKYDTEDHTFEEHFVVMKKLTGIDVGLHFMRHDRVVTDITHGFIQFAHFTMQVKRESSETSAKPQAVLIHGKTTGPPMTTKQSQHLLITHRNGIHHVL